MEGEVPASGGKVVSAVLRSKAKTVHFIRHAEGTHNRAAFEEGRDAYKDEAHQDARLTELGREQCVALRTAKPDLGTEAQLVIVSPLSRAINTAELSIDKVEGVPWIALECARERMGSHPCDCRRSVKILKEEFPFVDFDMIEHDEDALYHRIAGGREADDDVEERGRELLEFIGQRPETNIAVNCELRTVLLDL